MLKIFPIQSKEEQEMLCKQAGIAYDVDLLAYKATVDEEFVGICQFTMNGEGGSMRALAPALHREPDKEALILMARAALNFIDLCGVHCAFFDGDTSLPGNQLLHAIGFRPAQDGRLWIDLTDFFNSPCQHHQN